MAAVRSLFLFALVCPLSSSVSSFPHSLSQLEEESAVAPHRSLLSFFRPRPAERSAIALTAGTAGEHECQSPSLPRCALHIVFASWESEPCFAYMLDLGLTNACIFVYRRVDDHVPLRTWQGRCGVTVEERLLLPNHGRDAAAFFDHVAEHYDRLPRTLAFLHGHGPFQSFHTDSTTVASRMVAYYKAMVAREPIASHMVTLTKPGRTGSIEGWWNRRRLHFQEFPFVKHENEECNAILDRYNVSAQTDFIESCCASFLVSGDRIAALPRGVYEELRLSVLTQANDQSSTRPCFEYLVVRVFGEASLRSQPDILKWYLDIPRLDVARRC